MNPARNDVVPVATTTPPDPAHVALIDDVCHDVNGALAAIILCIDYLAEEVGRKEAPAVADARTAVAIAAEQMQKLRAASTALKVGLAGSGVFRV